jgi:hypothetical protein
MPKRIQFPRGVKGWRKPPKTIIVTRPFRWGNPFVVRKDLEPGTKIPGRHRTYTVVATAEDAVRCFQELMEASPAEEEAARREPRGKDVACNCELDQPCHADVCSSPSRTATFVPDEKPNASKNCRSPVALPGGASPRGCGCGS